MEINDITYKIIGCAYKVHSALGPGLLESTYEVCLTHELLKEGLKVEQQKILPILYDGIKLDGGYRIDLLVQDKVVVEIKSVEAIAEIHKAQVLTYLKLSGNEVGLLINFNILDMKKGITRLVLSSKK
jgi:GxxExxY protein